MSPHDGFEVAIFGIEASRWDVHGALAGRQGVWIGEGQLSGILDAPYESSWSQTARGGGATHVRDRYIPRDMTVGFHVNGTGSAVVAPETVAGEREAAFARALTSPPYRWSPTRRTARMRVTTVLSGARELAIRGTEVPDIDIGSDVLMDSYVNPLYSLRAGIPFWSSGLVDPRPAFETTSTTGSGTVEVRNPGDVPARYSIVLTPGDWTISDPSWSGEAGQVAPGGPHADRTIDVHVPVAAGGAIVSRDPRRIPIASASGENLVSIQQGRFLVYDLPPWTPPTELSISVRNAPAGGARAEYLIEKLWTRAWGMEAPEVLP
ncbi:hypothetical protein [Gordonia alkaliphila]|uniref:Minor tail protein n=1 Tax=Gordonia alkaliphila TaxID=1053547 RepID=A0ABP8ZKP3_9ACTN